MNKAKAAEHFREAKQYCYKLMYIDKQFQKDNPEYFLDYRPYNLLANLHLKYGNINVAIDNYNTAIDILSDDILNNEKISLPQFKKQTNIEKKRAKDEYEQAVKKYNETFPLLRIFKSKPNKADYNEAKRLKETYSRRLRKILDLSNMFNNLALIYYMSEGRKSKNHLDASKDIKNYTATADKIISLRASGNRQLACIYK